MPTRVTNPGKLLPLQQFFAHALHLEVVVFQQDGGILELWVRGGGMSLVWGVMVVVWGEYGVACHGVG